MIVKLVSSRSLPSAARLTRSIINGNRSTTVSQRRNIFNCVDVSMTSLNWHILNRRTSQDWVSSRLGRFFSTSSSTFSSSSSSTTTTPPAASDMFIKNNSSSPVNQQPPDANWREAASLIILAKDQTSAQSNSKNFDYKVLMVKRSGGSSFFASAYVFPGGQVESTDFDATWYRLFEKFGYDRQLLSSFSDDIVGPRPPIVTDSLTKRKHFPDVSKEALHCDIGLRISAIRETFEEAGILLCLEANKNGESNKQQLKESNLAIRLSSIELTKWQNRVREDSNSFFELCDTLGLVPNIWALYEWSDWLTPVSVGHRRFDTLFYVCCLDQLPRVAVDNAEIIKSVWYTPSEILEDNFQEKVFLAPPQVYEISRMLPQPNLDRFRKFAKARQILGTERWMPVIVTYDDGALSLIPGDPDYPQEPQLVSAGPVAEAEGTVDEAKARSSSWHNRIELRGTQSRALCTIEPGYGHQAPLDFPSSQFHNRSKL